MTLLTCIIVFRLITSKDYIFTLLSEQQIIINQLRILYPQTQTLCKTEGDWELSTCSSSLQLIVNACHMESACSYKSNSRCHHLNLRILNARQGCLENCCNLGLINLANTKQFCVFYIFLSCTNTTSLPG